MRNAAITVGISGGSGSIYAVRLLKVLAPHYHRINVVASPSARLVMTQELGMCPPDTGTWDIAGGNSTDAEILVWGHTNYNAPFASGSNCAESMVIVPCSMSTIAAIATGVDQNLMHHAAGVTLKEGKRLVVVPRETPLSTIHLRNLLTVSEAGVRVVPAMPGFYGGQSSFDELIDFVVQKIVNQIGVDIRLAPKWGEGA